MTKSKFQRLAAMAQIEADARRLASAATNPVHAAMYAVAADTLHGTAHRVCSLPEELVGEEIERGLVVITRALGKMAVQYPDLGAQAGLLPMRIAAECCSDT